MNKEIWKYQLLLGTNVIPMPKDAKVLAAQAQIGVPCIWCLVNPDNPTESRIFSTYGTGHPIRYNTPEQENRKYIGTLQIDGGAFIYHVFEEFK